MEEESGHRESPQRYTGIATFMHTPLVSDPAKLDIALIGVPFDPSGNTALVGATMMYEILCVLAESVVGRKQTEEGQ